jgi:hypothetical protein
VIQHFQACMPYGLSSRSTFHEADEFTVRACCSGTFNAYTREADPARLATAAVTRLKGRKANKVAQTTPARFGEKSKTGRKIRERLNSDWRSLGHADG